MGPEDWQGELLRIAGSFVTEPVLFADAYRVTYANQSGWDLFRGGGWVGVIAGAALWAEEQIAGHHERVGHHRPPEELLIVTMTAVVEAEVSWRAGRGWASAGVVRAWERRTLCCAKANDDYGLELTETGSDDRVVLTPLSLTEVDVRIWRELCGGGEQPS